MNKNEIKKLEELNLGELRGKEFNTRIEMYDAIENINTGISLDRRTCKLYIDGKDYMLVSKKANKKIIISYIFCDGIKDEWINEKGIKCVRQWLIFYK